MHFTLGTADRDLTAEIVEGSEIPVNKINNKMLVL
jgi:hypothetical protein